MLPSCIYLRMVLKLPACQAGTPDTAHASGSIWATDMPTWITPIATFGLLIGAIITAIYAAKAFGKQSQEVRAIEQQVTDQQKVTQQQARLLEIQSGQLELQRLQFDEQRQVNARQVEVFALQAEELRESVAQREREAGRQRRVQASRVFIAQQRGRIAPRGPDTAGGIVQMPGGPFVTATVRNASDLPIYNAELSWHLGTAGHGEPNPEPIGTILPGEDASREREFSYDLKIDSGAVVRFIDAAGVRWLRRPDGFLAVADPDVV